MFNGEVFSSGVKFNEIIRHRSHMIWLYEDTSIMFSGQDPYRFTPYSEDINSLAPGRYEWNFRLEIFKLISVINGWGIPCEIALRWMSLYLTDDKLTLVQVMGWCCQATTHYLSQCWPRSVLPYGITRLHWVNGHVFWGQTTGLPFHS